MHCVSSLTVIRVLIEEPTDSCILDLGIVVTLTQESRLIFIITFILKLETPVAIVVTTDWVR